MAGHFTFDGKAIPFLDGDTVGSALHRAGVKVIARSLKYHRPRGLYCCTGSCASCLVDVDGVPNTPACMASCRDGAEVRSQNRLGSAKHDLYAVTDKVFAKGFDPHDMFTKPRLLNEAFLVAVRHMSGVGKAPAQAASPAKPPRRFVTQCDELVVGGGLHGLRRAKEAAATGRSVILVEESPRLGGSALLDPSELEALALATQAKSWTTLAAWTGAVAFGVYGDVVGVLRGDDLHEVHAGRVTIATGRHDAWPLFANNDLPGVLSLRGARRLLHQHDVLPGRRVVGHPRLPADFVQALEEQGCSVVQGTVTEARGGTSVTGAKVDGKWAKCDAIVCDLPGTPRVELLQQAGCALAFRGGVLTNQRASIDGATTRPDVFAMYTEA